MRMALQVAAFEFLRVFKIKDAVITLVLFVCGALFYAWISGEEKRVKAPISVLGDAIQLENADHLPFNFLPAGAQSEDKLREMAASGDGPPVLVVHSIEDVEFFVKDERPSWYPQLLGVIRDAQRVAAMRGSGLSEDALSQVFADRQVELEVHEPRNEAEDQKRESIAFLCVMAMMLGVFMGNVHLFTGITGEKQNRVTESVMSAIPAQTWIDGKLIGLSLVAIYGLLVIAVCWFVGNEVYGIFREKFVLPLEIVDPVQFVVVLALTSLGFVLWFAFFGAIAATIDDPNTSSRSMFMFLPMMTMIVAIPGLNEPDDAMFVFWSIFPATSSTCMPVRLVVADPAWWELALAIGLLLPAIWVLRRFAGKVFATAMLTHGTELGWLEIWRVFRRA